MSLFVIKRTQIVRLRRKRIMAKKRIFYWAGIIANAQIVNKFKSTFEKLFSGDYKSSNLERKVRMLGEPLSAPFSLDKAKAIKPETLEMVKKELAKNPLAFFQAAIDTASEHSNRSANDGRRQSF